MVRGHLGRCESCGFYDTLYALCCEPETCCLNPSNLVQAFKRIFRCRRPREAEAGSFMEACYSFCMCRIDQMDHSTTQQQQQAPAPPSYPTTGPSPPNYPSARPQQSDAQPTAQQLMEQQPAQIQPPEISSVTGNMPQQTNAQLREEPAQHDGCCANCFGCLKHLRLCARAENNPAPQIYIHGVGHSDANAEDPAQSASGGNTIELVALPQMQPEPSTSPPQYSPPRSLSTQLPGSSGAESQSARPSNQQSDAVDGQPAVNTSGEIASTQDQIANRQTSNVREGYETSATRISNDLQGISEQAAISIDRIPRLQSTRLQSSNHGSSRNSKQQDASRSNGNGAGLQDITNTVARAQDERIEQPVARNFTVPIAQFLDRRLQGPLVPLSPRDRGSNTFQGGHPQELESAVRQAASVAVPTNSLQPFRRAGNGDVEPLSIAEPQSLNTAQEHVEQTQHPGPHSTSPNANANVTLAQWHDQNLRYPSAVRLYAPAVPTPGSSYVGYTLPARSSGMIVRTPVALNPAALRRVPSEEGNEALRTARWIAITSPELPGGAGPTLDPPPPPPPQPTNRTGGQRAHSAPGSSAQRLFSSVEVRAEMPQGSASATQYHHAEVDSGESSSAAQDSTGRGCMRRS